MAKKKILFITTNYPQFLEEFYQKNKNHVNLSYKQNQSLLFKQYFGTSNYYSKNIKQYGWQAEEIIANDWELQSKWAQENGISVSKDELFFYKYIPDRLINLLNLRNWTKKIVIAQIEKYKPDVVYTHHLSLFNQRDIKRIKKSTKLFVGQIASPLPVNKKPLYYYDLIISSFPHYVKDFRRMGIKSEYLRWCAESTLSNKIKSKHRIYNVSVVGSFSPYHSEGNKVFEKLAKQTKVDFWGYGEKTLSPTSPIRKNYHGQAWGKQMYQIFSQSKIVINRHINLSKQYANNLRLFEATLMGALLITDHKRNISDFFKVGHEIVTYKNADDLIEKVKYYLDHPKEAKKIARNGQKRTIKEHNYKVRMKELDHILRSYL